MRHFFQKHDKFCNLVSKSTASLHLCSVWRGIFRGRWKMTFWLRHKSVTQKTSKHVSLATSFHCDIWQRSYSLFQSALLFETGVPCRGIVRVKVLTSSCCGNEGSVTTHIKVVNVLGLQFIQQLMKRCISLNMTVVELFNAVDHYYNLLFIKVSLLSLKWNSLQICPLCP